MEAKEYLIVFRITSSSFRINFPSMSTLSIPIEESIKNCLYIKECESLLKSNPSLTSKDTEIDLKRMGWESISEDIFCLFFLWIGSGNVYQKKCDSDLIIFIVLSNYFQVCESKKQELIKALLGFKLDKFYDQIKNFWSSRFIPFEFIRIIYSNQAKSLLTRQRLVNIGTPIPNQKCRQQNETYLCLRKEKELKHAVKVFFLKTLLNWLDEAYFLNIGERTLENIECAAYLIESNAILFFPLPKSTILSTLECYEIAYKAVDSKLILKYLES